MQFERKKVFDLQPKLQGELIELRPLLSGDFDDLYTVASDPLIWGQHPAKNRHERKVFEKFFLESLDSGGSLIVIDSNNKKIIGSSRYNEYNPDKDEVEIGWTFLERSYWGGVYNKEMKRLMLQHAFNYVNKVIFLVGVQNMRSQQAVIKIGATRIGIRPDAGDNESIVYQVVKSDYLK
jgi:RimJ/RimL family protein N-acetyltransferase